MKTSVGQFAALSLIAFAMGALQHGAALAQGYKGYPYTIMTPEPGTGTRHGAPAPARTHNVTTSQGRQRGFGRRHFATRYAARGSSGSVLPTPLPRTQLIPPENHSGPVARAAPEQQGPTIVPGLAPVPNLPHGGETFQDRASRCAMQQGLYGVPNSASSQYMHACTM